MKELTVDSLTQDAQSESKPIDMDRLVRRFLGLIFWLVAVGIWLAPGASPAVDALLLKTGLTAILVFCAIAALLPRVGPKV